jgi:hypothetical protein
MSKGLTRKQETFVEAFVETGVGAEAARQAYDIPSENKQLAAVIASENLRKPEITQAVAERIKTREELADEAEESLLTAVRLDYFVFPKSMDDEEIEEHVEAQGLTCINVRRSEKGKLAFYAIPDGAARGKGLEIFHKVRGSFAPDKHLNVNVEVEASPDVEEAARILNEHFKGTSLTGNGEAPRLVGTQAQDQERSGNTD